MNKKEEIRLVKAIIESRMVHSSHRPLVDEMSRNVYSVTEDGDDILEVDTFKEYIEDFMCFGDTADDSSH